MGFPSQEYWSGLPFPSLTIRYYTRDLTLLMSFDVLLSLNLGPR